MKMKVELDNGTKIELEGTRVCTAHLDALEEACFDVSA
jgi:hypothetical protein